MSLLRGLGNHNHTLTILVLLQCFLSSAEEGEEEKKWISVFDDAAICEGSESQTRKYPLSVNVETQVRYEGRISDHPCFRDSCKEVDTTVSSSPAYIYIYKKDKPDDELPGSHQYSIGCCSGGEISFLGFTSMVLVRNGQ